MDRQADLETEADILRERVRKVYRVRGANLADSLQQAARHMPRVSARDGHVIVDALAKLGHPTLERTVDADAVEAARVRLTKHLNSINVWDVRKGKLLKLAGVIAFNIIVVTGLFITWMVITGQL